MLETVMPKNRVLELRRRIVLKEQVPEAWLYFNTNTEKHFGVTVPANILDKKAKGIHIVHERYPISDYKGDCMNQDIWTWRYDIQYRLDKLNRFGMLDAKNHPYNLQIENRRRYIKEKLKEIYYGNEQS